MKGVGNIKKFILYLFRWQLSTPILAFVMYKLPYETLVNTIIGNLVGGIVFYGIDLWILNRSVD